jgi:hypothetical protein
MARAAQTGIHSPGFLPPQPTQDGSRRQTRDSDPASQTTPGVADQMADDCRASPGTGQLSASALGENFLTPSRGATPGRRRAACPRFAAGRYAAG